MKSLIPNTPYTRKESLPSKEEIFDPVSNATNNVNKLRKIAGVTFPSDFIKYKLILKCIILVLTYISFQRSGGS